MRTCVALTPHVQCCTIGVPKHKALFAGGISARKFCFDKFAGLFFCADHACMTPQRHGLDNGHSFFLACTLMMMMMMMMWLCSAPSNMCLSWRMLRAGGTLALGMLVTLASVVYAAFRAGSNSSLFTLEGSEEEEGLEQVGVVVGCRAG